MILTLSSPSFLISFSFIIWLIKDPAFNSTLLKKMIPVMVEVGGDLLKQFSTYAPSQVVDMKVMFKRVALDLIGKFVIFLFLSFFDNCWIDGSNPHNIIFSAAFGTKFDSVSGNHSEIAKAVLAITCKCLITTVFIITKIILICSNRTNTYMAHCSGGSLWIPELSPCGFKQIC